VSNSRAPETLADLAGETGATAVWAREAATDADLVIVSIPQKNVVDLAPGIVAGAKPGAPVIRPTTTTRASATALSWRSRPARRRASGSEQLGVPVLKMFNGIFWKHLLEGGLPRGSSGRIALPVAGDDDDAGKQIVFDLVDELGFDPVDGGTLAESWRQQPGTPVYGADLHAEGAIRALSAASPERPDAFRAAG
jgi:predicted dinucleotide-binding enzyme